MRRLVSKLRTRIALATLSVVCLALVGTLAWRASARQQTQAEQGHQKLYARVRDGVGSEVHFASAHASAANVRASVNEVAQFIHKRSGVQLGGATKNRLAQLEQETLDGTRRRISITELGDIMSATALERLANITDTEITRLDQEVRGFDDPNLPAGFRRERSVLKLRVGQGSRMDSEQFCRQVKALRGQIGTPAGEVLTAMARRIAGEEVHKKASLFSAAVPEQFGGVWDAAQNKDGAVGLTPLQAFLIAYSVASEDPLTDSEANLNKRMMVLHDTAIDFFKEDYPSPAGHTAYGINGYFFSSPLDLVFDERTVNVLLDQMAERSAS
jgi:hypothetical protein